MRSLAVLCLALAVLAGQVGAQDAGALAAATKCSQDYLASIATINRNDLPSVCAILDAYKTCMNAAVRNLDANTAATFLGQVSAVSATVDCRGVVSSNRVTPEIHAVDNILHLKADNLFLETADDQSVSIVGLNSSLTSLQANYIDKSALSFLATKSEVAVKADQTSLSSQISSLAASTSTSLSAAVSSLTSSLAVQTSNIARTSTAVVTETSRATLAETSLSTSVQSLSAAISDVSRNLSSFIANTNDFRAAIQASLSAESSTARANEAAIAADVNTKFSNLNAATLSNTADISSNRASFTRISDCSSRGQLFMNGACINPPTVTQASSPTCNASTNGVLRFNSNTGTFEACDGRGNYRPLGGIVFESCLAIKTAYPNAPDGIYTIRPGTSEPFPTYCDMATNGGGWTLVASVHEDCIECKCDAKDRWSSTKGDWCNVHSSYIQPSTDVYNSYYRGGDGNWQNTATFGSVSAATSDDYKNPAYFDMTYDNVAIMHVPNNRPVSQWKSSTWLHYFTDNNFMRNEGGNLRNLYLKYPVRSGEFTCSQNMQTPRPPIVYQVGDINTIRNNMSPNARAESQQGFVHFRVTNNEGASFALCSGVLYSGCNTEHACVGSSGYAPEGCPLQCGDFAGMAWDGPRHCRPLLTNSASTCDPPIGWSASGLMTDSTILILVR